MQEFQGRVVVQRIDVNKYVNYTEYLEIETIPTVYLKGKEIKIFSGEDISFSNLYEQSCLLFFEPIDQCFIFY